MKFKCKRNNSHFAQKSDFKEKKYLLYVEPDVK